MNLFDNLGWERAGEGGDSRKQWFRADAQTLVLMIIATLRVKNENVNVNDAIVCHIDVDVVFLGV